VLIGACLSLAVAVACAPSTTSSSVSVVSGPAPVGLAAPATPPPPIGGLIDMQDIHFHDNEGGEPMFTMGFIANTASPPPPNFSGLFGGIVINATWDLIQPNPSPAPLNFAQIDGPLTMIEDYNMANPSAPLGVKLRIYAGDNAPLWAKQINGGPVQIYRNSSGCDGSDTGCPIYVGKYWTPAFISAWRAFQAAVAARYDSKPPIVQIAVTSCASQTDEPFVPSSYSASKNALIAAGYTDAAEQSCLTGAVADYASWHRALIDFTFNTFSSITGAGSVNGVTNAQFTINVMTACRQQLGNRCVLDNHALESPPYSVDQTVYNEMQVLGPPINFQTQSPVGMSCQWIETIAQGVAYGAGAIEIWPEMKYYGFDTLTVNNIQQLNSLFTNPIPVPTSTPPPSPCPGFH